MAESEFYKQNTLPNLHEDTASVSELPEKVGPYTIESLLNKGGMSYLYLARSSESSGPLVVKVLSPAYLKHEEMKQRFLKEARIIQMADHPNIIKLYGEGEWEGGLYIAMEFIRGVSLRQFIMQQTLSLKSALDIVLQVSYALLHLHTHGVIHRDLKPENILIAEGGSVKVIDFGIAQLIGDTSRRSASEVAQMFGTPNYMSPEQKKSAQSISVASDIYSLGVIAYELILGKFSFGSIQINLIPQGMRPIIKKALEPNENDRYTDVVDLITDLNEYIASKRIEKDRHGRDHTQALLEEIAGAHRKLLPSDSPNFNELEVGLARSKNIASLGLFYDYIKFPSGSFLIYLGEFSSSEVQSLPHTGYLKGIIRTLYNEQMMQPMKALSPDEFIGELNQIIVDDHYLGPFAAQFIHLRPDDDSLSFLACGMSPLWHIPFGSTAPRKLISDNRKIGESKASTFTFTSDNWEEGDGLFLHSFNADAEEDIQELDSHIQTHLSEYIHLTPKKQAEGMYRSLISLSQYTQEECPKAAISLQRIM